jgi:hypothetical protein
MLLSSGTFSTPSLPSVNVMAHGSGYATGSVRVSATRACPPTLALPLDGKGQG